MSLVSHLLKQRADIYRRTLVSDGQGGSTCSYALVKANAKCKIDQASASQQFEADQASSSHTHSIYLEADESIRRGDEIRRLGKSYRVDVVVQPSTSDVYLRADSEEIQTEGADV